VFWTYLVESTMGYVTCLAGREPLLRKVRFHALSVSLTAVINLGMNFIAVIVFAVANGVSPRLGWFEMFPIVSSGGALRSAVALGLTSGRRQVR
jgi:ABC-2 type transport system permease protein